MVIKLYIRMSKLVRSQTYQVYLSETLSFNVDVRNVIMHKCLT